VTDFVVRFLAILAVGAQALVLAFVALAVASTFAPGARRAFAAVRRALAGLELWAAWSVAAVATIGSLYFSEVADFVPCELCWFQRIAMYPLAIVLLLAARSRDRRGAYYGAALPVLGGIVSAYHIYVERHPEAEPESCRIGAPCSTRWIWEFGYVSIPVLALTAFAAIGVLLALAWWPQRRDASDTTS
jgi:hypothetical protein